MVLDVACSKGLREGETPVMAVRDGHVLPKVKKTVLRQWRRAGRTA